MKSFRKKSVIVQARQITKEWFNGTCLVNFPGIEIDLIHHVVRISTVKGIMKGNIGDWIIRGVEGNYAHVSQISLIGLMKLWRNNEQ